MPGVEVDGNDVLAVHEAAARGRRRAPAPGGGPTLLECRTYRTRPHAEGMGDYTYRTREEVEAWKATLPDRAPARLMTRRTRPCGALELDGDRSRGRGGIVADAREFAEASPWPDPATATRVTCIAEPTEAARGRAVTARRADIASSLHAGHARSARPRRWPRIPRSSSGRRDRQARRKLQDDRRALRPVRPRAALRHADLRTRVRRPRLRRGDDRHATGGRLHVRRLRPRLASARSSTRSPRCST